MNLIMRPCAATRRNLESSNWRRAFTEATSSRTQRMKSGKDTVLELLFTTIRQNVEKPEFTRVLGLMANEMAMATSNSAREMFTRAVTKRASPMEKAFTPGQTEITMRVNGSRALRTVTGFGAELMATPILGSG